MGKLRQAATMLLAVQQGKVGLYHLPRKEKATEGP